ncbi:flagellar motor protein MotB [Chitinophaga silvatica]|uniref:Flagellar motor protein MotB n=1 Tax=Chitinophaga silvatica TaxID=2282649 RepID=A0A3E1Y660_9BACT|nr:OmpA family protein [Chitinophaga silvatica]RFS20224.1 flagellar motor protein MotB [Chitinophaga silvatica]
MKRRLSLVILSIILFTGQLVHAQYVLKEANVQFGLFNYTKAIDLYEQAYKKKQTLYAAEKLGACYEQIQHYKQTESWYAIAVGLDSSKTENILAYAKALQQNSKYTEAKIQYQKYAIAKKDVPEKQLILWLQSCDSAISWMKTPTATTIINEKVWNTDKSEWGTALYLQNIVFTSDRENINSSQTNSRSFLKFDGANVPDKKTYGWTGNHYLRLYQQDKTTDSTILFPLKTGTVYHIGAASFTEDGMEMYFTLTRIPKKTEYVKGKLATINIEIYYSKKNEQGNWTTPTAFKYNKVNEYSVGDPFISKDGNHLYFVSNMPNGAGGTDLYVCHKTATGEWDLPINLKDLNTEGNERTPAIDSYNNFYFSSDGRVGMGGLDVYQAQLVDGKISTPKNMGYPTNSPQDDFAYTPITSTTGYLSSNRPEGLGNDDIYSYAQTPSTTLEFSGRALNLETNQPLANAVVSLTKINGQTIKTLTDENGNYKFNLDNSSDYQLTIESTNHRSNQITLTSNELKTSNVIKKDLFLEVIKLDELIKLENIYYDYKKSEIRADAAIELDKLVKILKDNPTIWIELGSHTDSRGNDQYNQKLSQSRANAAVQYMIDKGIEKNRITAKGYGESMLLNKCSNGVDCTEEEHQLNRRTTFKIVKK